MKITAAVLPDDTAAFTSRELDLDPPRPDEVLVKVSGCGVCHTDLFMRPSSSGVSMVLGHETSGVVLQTGSAVSHVQPGDKVVQHYTYCGKCPPCTKGRTWECVHFSTFFGGLREDGTTPLSYKGRAVAPLLRQGGFATHTVCHENGVTRVDATTDISLMGPLGCGVMTGAGSVMHFLTPEKGRALAVFGVGCVGLSAIMAAKMAGCAPLIAVDRLPLRLEMARNLGATHCLDSGKEPNLAAAIHEISGGLDYAFDTSGARKLLDVLQTTLKPGARACGVGIGGSVQLTMEQRQQGISWESTDAGWALPQRFIPELLQHHKTGRFPWDKLVQRYPFEAINEAFAAHEQGTAIKPVLVLE